MGLKQVWSCFVFPREFSSLFRASRVQLGLLRSFSCGDLRWLASLSRDVTGKALLTILDFVAPLRLWHSLRPPSDGWFGCESLAGRLPGQPCARLSAPSSGAPESCKREEKRESAPLARHLFNCPVWTPPTGGWSNQIVRMGRSSTHVHGFLARHFQWRKE